MDRATSIDGADTIREFYLPATYGFSSTPGRLERFLTRLLRSRDPGARTAGEMRDDLYLPATLR